MIDPGPVSRNKAALSSRELTRRSRSLSKNASENIRHGATGVGGGIRTLVRVAHLLTEAQPVRTAQDLNQTAISSDAVISFLGGARFNLAATPVW